MVRSKSTTNKGINAKRIQEIVNYDLSLGMLVNPNIKQQLVLNCQVTINAFCLMRWKKVI